MLSGGDPNRLRLATFLDAAHAMQIREAVRMGMPLVDAIDRFDDGERTVRPTGRDTTTTARVPTAAENDRALAQLQAMLGGVSKRG